MNTKALLAFAMAAIMSFAALAVIDSESDAQSYDRDLGKYYDYTVSLTFSGTNAEGVNWDFGDGSATKSGYAVTHTYSKVGTYYITQDAWNAHDIMGNQIAERHTTAVYKIEILGYPEVIFDSNGGSSVEKIVLTSAKSVVTKPTDPTKQGHTFGGWYTDSALTTAFDWTSQVDKNTKLYAKWTINKVTVTFNSDGGNTISPITVDWGSTVSEPTKPTKSGFTFLGWYTGTTQFSFNSPIKSSVTLNATWQAVSSDKTVYLITFDANGGTAGWASVNCPQGNSVYTPDAVREGYTFAGWYNGDSFVGNAGVKLTPTGSMTLKAHWTVTQGGSADITEKTKNFFSENLVLVLIAIGAIIAVAGYLFGSVVILGGGVVLAILGLICKLGGFL